MNWKMVYRIIPIRKMGWYYPSLDPDLENALIGNDIQSGSFLDIGTGPGTQAIELVKRGFDVTGTDLSATAIKKASRLSDRVQFLQDDILKTNLNKKFDYVLDRGCFHVLNEKHWTCYLKNLARLVQPKGYFFLKCMSDKQQRINIGPFRIPERKGPHRFSKKTISALFSEYFNILEIHETVYQGTRNELPKTLFAIMRSKS